MKNLKNLSQKVGTKVLEAGLLFAVVAPSAVLANSPLSGGVDQARPTETAETGLMDIFATIANIMLFVLGAVAVIMLIIGGFRYVVSGGDSSAVEGAKNTILYAVVGIIVAFLAWAAVNFVVESLDSGFAS